MLDDFVTKIIFDQIMSLAAKFNAGSKELNEMDSTKL
jgi:hypothetical protein